MNDFIFTVLCLKILLFASEVSSGGSEDILDLSTAYDLAKINAPALAISRYEVDIVQAQRDEARGQLLPSISVFGQWSENRLTYDGPLGDIYSDSRYPGERYGAQLTQPLFDKARWSEFSRQKLLVGAAKKELAQSEIDLLKQVVAAFLEVLVARANEVALTEELEAITRQRKQAVALFDRSMIPITELLETQAREQTVSADVIAARAESEISLQKLATFLGGVPHSLNELKRSFQLRSDITSLEIAVDLALRNTPAIAAAELQVAAAIERIEREKGSRWPRIDLVLSQQYSDVGFDNLASPPRTSESVQIALNYPLWQGGVASARIRGARADLHKTKETLKQIKRDVEEQTRYAVIRLSAATAHSSAAEHALEVSEVAVSATQKAKLVGEARAVDVLLALSQRSNAARDLAVAQSHQILAWLNLELIACPDPSTVVVKLTKALEQ